MRFAVVVTIAVALIPQTGVAQAGLAELRPLLGTWDTEDTYYPETGSPVVERGVRTCRMVLLDRYLQCETRATNARGVERTYWFLINDYPGTGRFEMVSLWSNLPFKAVHQITRGERDRAWRITGMQMIGDAEPNTHHSDLVFDGPDRIVWTGRRVRQGGSAEDAPISFVETWRRRAP